MAEARYSSRNRHLYPTDLLSILLALLFALGSFFNVGKIRVQLLGVGVDRELLVGFIFVLIAVALPVLFRWVNAIRNRVVQFFRLFYPQILYLLFYQEAIRLSHLFYGGRTFDAIFAKADQVLFSFQPSIQFHRLFDGIAPVNELFFFSYFSFFALMTVGWWILYVRGERSKAVSALTIVTLSFYLLYVLYALFPVEGPKYYFPSLHQKWYDHFKGYLFTELMQRLFDHVDLAGAAFPSSHVAISTLSLLLNFRHSPKIGATFLPVTLVLYFATVYIYAHYAVDVFAGLIVALLFWFAIPPLLRRLTTLFEFLDSLSARRLHLPPIAFIELETRS